MIGSSSQRDSEQPGEPGHDHLSPGHGELHLPGAAGDEARHGRQEEGGGVGPVPVRERLPEGPPDGPQERIHGAPEEGPGRGLRHVRGAGGALWKLGRTLLRKNNQPFISVEYYFKQF